MAKPVQQARPKQSDWIWYYFPCQAAHHAERSSQDGWSDGVCGALKAPPPPAPPPTLECYCGACQAAIDAGEAP